VSATAFDRFRDEAGRLRPATAIVLGSGLAGAVSAFREVGSIPFDSVPGLISPSVRGHAGRISLAKTGEVAVLISYGRLHYYEGHDWDRVTEPVRVLAGLGVKRLVLTNSAGGIHSSLGPGSLMVIRDHIPVFNRDAWREIARGGQRPSPYSPSLIESIGASRELLAGTYAAVTGPSYETPAEIRALRASGADAVGMSTAKEAEAAAAIGIEVAAISCITNRAAGLGDTRLDHAEVLANARLAVDRLGEVLAELIR
jgi:purine-nucleoside phosphorylase